MRVVWTNVQMYYFIGHVYIAMYGEIDPDPHRCICDPSLIKMLIIIFDGFSCSRTLPRCSIRIRLLLGSCFGKVEKLDAFFLALTVGFARHISMQLWHISIC